MNAPALKHVAARSRRKPLVAHSSERVRDAVMEMIDAADRPDLSRDELLVNLGKAALHACQAYRDSASPDTRVHAAILIVDVADRATFLGFGWRT